ncbi:hypothetical protein PAXRUDRAFT_163224, partial [Paxillus rubicundulus Ve08.2h10]
ITCITAEWSAEKHLEYMTRIGKYEAEQLVFVDESSVNCCTMYCGCAWSIWGSKVQHKAFFICGKQYSVLPALTLNEDIIHCDIVEGSFYTEIVILCDE